MTSTMLPLIAGAALLAGVSAFSVSDATAGEPVQLTNAQMDGVTAAARKKPKNVAVAKAFATAIGNASGPDKTFSFTLTDAFVQEGSSIFGIPGVSSSSSISVAKVGP